MPGMLSRELIFSPRLRTELFLDPEKSSCDSELWQESFLWDLMLGVDGVL